MYHLLGSILTKVARWSNSNKYSRYNDDAVEKYSEAVVNNNVDKLIEFYQ